MFGRVFQFAPRRQAGWTTQEQAEFLRIGGILGRAGMPVEVETGLTDEGEPWAVFCLSDGEPIVHLARLDGLYLLCAAHLEAPARGHDLRGLLQDLARTAPTLLPQARPIGRLDGDLLLHPSALLLAVIATAWFLSAEPAAAHAPGLLAGGPFRAGTGPQGGGDAGHQDSPGTPAQHGAHDAPETQRQAHLQLLLATVAVLFASEIARESESSLRQGILAQEITAGLVLQGQDAAPPLHQDPAALAHLEAGPQGMDGPPAAAGEFVAWHGTAPSGAVPVAGSGATPAQAAGIDAAPLPWLDGGLVLAGGPPWFPVPEAVSTRPESLDAGRAALVREAPSPAGPGKSAAPAASSAWQGQQALAQLLSLTLQLSAADQAEAPSAQKPAATIWAIGLPDWKAEASLALPEKLLSLLSLQIASAQKVAGQAEDWQGFLARAASPQEEADDAPAADPPGQGGPIGAALPAEGGAKQAEAPPAQPMPYQPPPVAQPSPTPQGSAGSVGAPAQQAWAAANSALQDFLQDAPNYFVILSKTAIVLVDPVLLGHGGSYGSFSKVETFQLVEGFEISIIRADKGDYML